MASDLVWQEETWIFTPHNDRLSMKYLDLPWLHCLCSMETMYLHILFSWIVPGISGKSLHRQWFENGCQWGKEGSLLVIPVFVNYTVKIPVLLSLGASCCPTRISWAPVTAKTDNHPSRLCPWAHLTCRIPSQPLIKNSICKCVQEDKNGIIWW